MRFYITVILAVLAAILFPSVVVSQDSPILDWQDRFHPVYAKNGMVASQEARATQEGVKVLEEGGNAVDAAVTVGFVLAVTLPRAGNIGGGGFMLVHMAKNDETVAIDYREKAPYAATKNMFLDGEGEADDEKSRYSYQAIGVPGTVAGLVLALEKYGTIPLARAIAPAIRYAEKGMKVSYGLEDGLERSKERFQACPESMKIFFKASGENYKAGEILLQKDLAWSLQQIAQHGAKAFYEGEIAAKIVADMKANDGLISAKDLADYRPVIRKPVVGTYRGYKICSMPPPSSGGIHLIQMLNILEQYPIGKLGHNSAQTIHLMVETMRLAYADRSKHLGDTDFVKVPISGLLSKPYAEQLREKINPEKALLSSNVSPGKPWPYESNETTHYSVVDKYGNAVSNTYTLNFSYGTKIVAKGTGILMNNEMDDFSSKPGSPNAFGLIGDEANAIEPQKRMLSSMTPTIVFKDNRPFLVTGSPGGSRIITTTLQIVMNVIDHDMNIATATNAVRIHHQWLPDVLLVEKGLSKDTKKILRSLGHTIQPTYSMGSTQSIIATDKGLFGASDPRRLGAMTAGH